MRDLIGLTVSGRVGVFHEHSIAPRSSLPPDPRRPLFDQHVLEGDPGRARQLRRAMLRDLIVNASRRFIFVCEREPRDRLISFFQKRHMGLLQRLYDPGRRALSETAELQRVFDAWLDKYAAMQSEWYRERLLENFGLNVLDCEPTHDGLLMGHSGPNTLLIVPTARLNTLRTELADVFGGTAYDAVASNSLDRRGGREIDRAFRRQIHFDSAIDGWLNEIPEVAHITRFLHGREAAMEAGSLA
jgi:hypothetical protein